jgi:hypothetical protein
MIRIRFVASLAPWLHSLRGSAHFARSAHFVAPPSDIVTGLRYIGLVVIVNAVLSKLGVVT